MKGATFFGSRAVTLGPSREYDITFFVEGRLRAAHHLRDSTVAARRVQRTVLLSRATREISFPWLKALVFPIKVFLEKDLLRPFLGLKNHAN